MVVLQIIRFRLQKSYVDFLRELRIKLGSNYLITAAVGADPSLIGTSYTVADLNRFAF